MVNKEILVIYFAIGILFAFRELFREGGWNDIRKSPFPYAIAIAFIAIVYPFLIIRDEDEVNSK